MKRALMAITIAAIVFGGVFGLAASLNVTSSTLGAGNVAVAACQAGAINVTFAPTAPAYSTTLPGYETTDVTLNGIAAGCQSKSFKVTLTGPGLSNASLGDQSGTTAAAATTTMTFSAVSVADVTGVHVTIYG